MLLVRQFSGYTINKDTRFGKLSTLQMMSFNAGCCSKGGVVTHPSPCCPRQGAGRGRLRPPSCWSSLRQRGSMGRPPAATRRFSEGGAASGDRGGAGAGPPQAARRFSEGLRFRSSRIHSSFRNPQEPLELRRRGLSLLFAVYWKPLSVEPFFCRLQLCLAIQRLPKAQPLQGPGLRGGDPPLPTGRRLQM